MILAVVLEKRFTMDDAGGLWTEDAFSRSFWDRYRTVFDEVRIVARVARAEPGPSMLRADGDGVVAGPLPAYVGPGEFVRKRAMVRAAMRRALADADAVLLRTPGVLASLGYAVARRRGLALGVEVVGDPADVFAAGVSDHPLRLGFKVSLARSLRRQCATADVAAYVTERTLQARYPPGEATFATHYSSVELGDEAFASVPRIEPRETFRIITVTTLDSMYKGVDVLLRAVARSGRRGRLHLDVVGDGRYRESLRKLAENLGLLDSVRFVGRLPGASAVRAAMEGSDLFVLASRTEGLPRALIEAMALGLPCIATDVGGVPELLGRDSLVTAGADDELASAIDAVLGDHQRRWQMAERNLARSRSFHTTSLAARRREAYERLASAASRSGGGS